MPQNSGRRRAAPHRRRGPAGAANRVANRPAANRPPANRTPANRPPAPRADRTSALDLALTAAAAAPLPADTTFRELGLPGRLADVLAAQGLVAPFAIQASTIPDALAGRDVLGRAQTGSGKTLAFGLPMLARLAGPAGQRRPKAPHGLVLVPTRELAVQVADTLAPLGQVLGVTVMTVYGGVSISRQIDRLRRGVDIVVATPGRLIDLLERSACTLGEVEITVLDEADHMADLGFLPAVTRLLDATPEVGQRMLFSATLDRGVEALVGSYLSDPALHAVASIGAPDLVDHQVFVLPAQDKVAIAAEIGGRPGRTLFFVRTKHGADRLARQLTRAGVDAAAIHGNLNQNQRQRALTAFTAGHPRVLVATDVAARGIHVDDIELIVHFDPPNDHKDYLHRSGRTARAGASGTVVALVEPAQVREFGRLHQAAGVTPTSHQVQPGHHAVRQVATSGTPIPPAAAPSYPAPGLTRRQRELGRGGNRTRHGPGGNGGPRANGGPGANGGNGRRRGPSQASVAGRRSAAAG